MTRTPSPQAATRFAIPRTLMAGFILAAVATLVIGLVNFRSAETRTEAVRAMNRTTLACSSTMTQSLFVSPSV